MYVEERYEKPKIGEKDVTWSVSLALKNRYKDMTMPFSVVKVCVERALKKTSVEFKSVTESNTGFYHIEIADDYAAANIYEGCEGICVDVWFKTFRAVSVLGVEGAIEYFRGFLNRFMKFLRALAEEVNAVLEANDKVQEAVVKMIMERIGGFYLQTLFFPTGVSMVQKSVLLDWALKKTTKFLLGETYGLDNILAYLPRLEPYVDVGLFERMLKAKFRAALRFYRWYSGWFTDMVEFLKSHGFEVSQDCIGAHAEKTYKVPWQSYLCSKFEMKKEMYENVFQELIDSLRKFSRGYCTFVNVEVWDDISNGDTALIRVRVYFDNPDAIFTNLKSVSGIWLPLKYLAKYFKEFIVFMEKAEKGEFKPSRQAVERAMKVIEELYSVEVRHRLGNLL